MKKSLSLLSLAVILLTGITSCNSNKNTPERVAKDWLDAYYSQDYGIVKRFSTKETKREIEQHLDSFPKPDNTSGTIISMSHVVIKSVKTEGSRATVEWMFKQAPEEVMKPLKLVKENDRWLVQM